MTKRVDRKDDQAQSQRSPPVVGIGASAGGIEALQQFFSAIPDDLGLAYVVVVHLAPDRESELPAILARHTSMPVEQVGDHDTAKLAPDRIYVIAPNRKLEITETSVGASQFEQPRGQRSAIDLFFRSLAARHGDGFAIILSGSGTDGAVGAKAVKEAGGLVLVQDPREAAHDGMPRAVISTGVADVVLPVRELAARLPILARIKHEVAALLRTAEEEPPLHDEDSERALRHILEMLRKRTGHDFSRYKRGTVLRRMARRMQLSHRTTVAEYQEYLDKNVEEVQALFDDLLITVTTFFRDSTAWQALQTQVIGPLVELAEPDEPIRVWVPGCATGEEAYTLAILFQEEIERRKVDRNFTIFASDVDEGALATAREGVYPSAIVADVSEDRLDRFFRLRDHHYRVAGNIRERVVFASHSLLRDPPFSKLNLISCRNLLIYLDRELQDQVMGLFQYACRQDGYLFLGMSESADARFRSLDKKHRIFQVLKTSEADAVPLPALLATPRGPLRHELGWPPVSRQPAAEVHLEVLEAIGPPSLVVDEQWNVLHLSDSAARFLQQRGGPIARRITDVVRPELRDEVHMVVHRTLEDGESQLSPFVLVRFNGTPRRVAVLAQRHRQGQSGSANVLLTFLEGGEASREEISADGEPSNELVRGLREKLRQADLRADTMRDDQHLANEDLRAANEELQSLNEEYRSTTEELETSKEELQSINEELQTVNHELKSKVEALSRANDDLENLMAATNIATLFLDRELRIKRFTPQLADIFNVTSRDQGRPIGNFTHSLRYDTFLKDVRSVLADGAPIERESASEDARTFIIRIAPYVAVTETTEGVVVTLVDVSQLKRAEAVLRESEEQFRALVDASAQMVWRMDAEGRVAEDSPSWRAFTGQTCEQWKADWLEAVHPDDRELARRAWREAVGTTTTFSAEFRVYHAPSQQYRWTTVRAVPLRQPDGAVRGWVGMNTDVNERREAEEGLRDADHRKDEFLALLGHELRNPLAAIRNSAAIHRAGTHVDETSRRAWAVVDRQSKHMTRLINDLLDIVRIDRGKLELQHARVSLTECIEDVVEAVQPRVDVARLTLKVDVTDEPLYIDADPERIVQVLGNLLRNAVTYTDAGGEISIVARQEGGFAEVTIGDTGIGMNPGQIEALFEPYRQADSSRRGGGLGLGLTLVKRLVKLHGGTATAYSEGLGKGSRFQITLPLSGDASAVRAAPVERPAAHRILVVDDEADVADMFAAVLESLGQNVEVAHSGEKALETARRQAPDVAFLDLSMPVMGGRELARRLREEMPSNTPLLVALSGYGIDTRPTAVEFDRHLLKPVSIDTVIELLNSIPEGAR